MKHLSKAHANPKLVAKNIINAVDDARAAASSESPHKGGTQRWSHATKAAKARFFCPVKTVDTN